VPQRARAIWLAQYAMDRIKDEDRQRFLKLVERTFREL
jgi:hypothetical protein